MKKFKFTLQALFDYKVTVEKMQKSELKKAQQALQELLNEEMRLLQAYADNERSLERALAENLNVGRALSEHDAFFRFLRDALKAIRERVLAAEEVVRACQERLITTMKEIKTYNKLRDEQLVRYRKEVQAEETKEIEDLVSFNVINE
ncbi:MAG: flagellar export protein FliJ [Oscillospiraceae bacterium]|nr:flagellar export protein FliJ [Oscillospiraceae bacterium]